MYLLLANVIMFLTAVSSQPLTGPPPSRHTTLRPTVTCHIATVSYRFVGDPGTEFRYDGDTWRIPQRGWIELVASRTASAYQVGEHSLPLEVWPRDAFGTRIVPLPRTH
jgi:hypothetical protein